MINQQDKPSLSLQLNLSLPRGALIFHRHKDLLEGNNLFSGFELKARALNNFGCKEKKIQKTNNNFNDL